MGKVFEYWDPIRLAKDLLQTANFLSCRLKYKWIVGFFFATKKSPEYVQSELRRVLLLEHIGLTTHE